MNFDNYNPSEQEQVQKILANEAVASSVPRDLAAAAGEMTEADLAAAIRQYGEWMADNFYPTSKEDNDLKEPPTDNSWLK